MTKNIQIFPVGKRADCLRTCISCLFDVDPREIPNFGYKFKEVMPAYLEIFIYILSKYEKWMVVDHKKRKNGYSIGIFKTGENSSHAVILKNGKMHHDPAPKYLRQKYGKFLHCVYFI